MLTTCDINRLDSLGATELSDALEEGHIVHFPCSPVRFPVDEDLRFLRDEMPRHLRRKNISYHPEIDRVMGMKAPREVLDRTREILRGHSRIVREFLERTLATLAEGWRIGTSSFRPLEEKGRDLSPHASNERVHVDAGAYGATHGDRILRFFMNANESEDRVWVTKGRFQDVYRRHAAEARVGPGNGAGRDLSEGLGNRLWSGALEAISAAGFPLAKLADTSPYDRLMRRFHNWMKDTPEFQSSEVGHREFRFGPFSAWMVFTDGVSHACVSGRHAFIDTFVIPLRNCRRPDLTPYHLLRHAPA